MSVTTDYYSMDGTDITDAEHHSVCISISIPRPFSVFHKGLQKVLYISANLGRKD